MAPRRRTRSLAGGAATALCLLVSGCVLGSSPTPGVPDGDLPRPDHVVVVVFENEDAEDVLGSGEAPYLDSLAASGATLTDSHALTHPSQPNYLALFSGSVHGVTDNECPVELSGDNLASQLADAGLTFVGYSEGLPQAGYTGCESGDYVRKHSPWVDFADLPESVNQPLSAMPADYDQLPTVSFITPDLCSDMHDCEIAVGDAWAEEVLGPYATWAQDHDSLLIVTFDEDSGTDDNRIATIVAGDGVRATSSDQRADHYGVLRTLEDMYGLPPLGEAAGATPIAGIWETTGS